MEIHGTGPESVDDWDRIGMDLRLAHKKITPTSKSTTTKIEIEPPTTVGCL
jgi:hypothetical protein